MQPDSALPNEYHRNCVIGRATDKLDPDPSHACNHYGRDRINLGAIPGVSSFSPAGSQGFLPTLHPAVKLDALPGSSCQWPRSHSMAGATGGSTIALRKPERHNEAVLRISDRLWQTTPAYPVPQGAVGQSQKTARKAHVPWRASGSVR